MTSPDDETHRPTPALAEALDAAGHGALLTDARGRVLFVNRAAERLLSRADAASWDDGLVGRVLHDVYPHLAEGAFAEARRRVLHGGAVEAQASLRSPVTGRLWDVRLVSLDEGRQLLVELDDVTARAALESKMQLLTRDFPFGALVVLDPELRYVSAGGRGLSDVGLEPSDLVGRSFYDVWPEETLEAIRDAHEGALEGREARQRVSYRGREYEMVVLPVQSRDGEVLRIVVLTLDVTDHVRIRGELRLIGEAVSALHLGVTIADARAPDLPLIYVNDGFTRVTGYEPDETLGRNCRFLQGPGTDPDDVAAIREALDTGEAVQRTLLNYRRDGESFWNRLSIYPVRDGGGELTHFVGIQEDVTRQREMGEELEVRRRLSAVGELAGGVAHDIRNVLMGVGGLLELGVDRDDLPQEVRDDLTEARTVLARARSVTDRLMVFARESSLDPRATELVGLLHERQRFLRSVLREDISLEIETPDETVWVRMDPGQFDQVLLNLLRNAEQAMPGGGRVVVSLAAGDAGRMPFTAVQDDDEPRAWACVTVSDTGRGMDAETRKRATEPFFTTKAPGEGTGLGLSTVYGVVTQLGGDVAIESEPGEGTRVHLGLPVTEAPTDVESEARDAPRGTGTVLLVEDDPTVRRACERALEGRGHRVLPRADGREGLDAFLAEANRVDLVLTDAVMPSMSGLEMGRRIHDVAPDVPVVVMSGYGGGELDESERPEAFRYLAKPFELDELIRTVEEEMGR